MGNIKALPTFSIPTAMAELKGVSRYVNRWVDLEIYKDDIPVDEITPTEILKWAYHKAYTRDLEPMGVTIHMDLDELCHDFHHAELIVAALRILSQEYLESAIITVDMADTVETLIAGDNLFEDLVTYLGAMYPNDEHVSRLLEDIDVFSTDDYVFDHLEELICDIRFELESKYESAEDFNDSARYMKYIQWRRNVAKYAVEHMMDDSTTDDTRAVVTHYMNRYDLDKIQSGNVAKYAAIDREGFDIAMDSSANTLMDMHHSINAHHIEYWIASGGEITDAGLLALISHHYMPDIEPDHPCYAAVTYHYNFRTASRLDDFTANIKDMISTGMRHGLFKGYHIEFINRHADKLSRHLAS